jgi:hypothetical protein
LFCLTLPTSGVTRFSIGIDLGQEFPLETVTLWLIYRAGDVSKSPKLLRNEGW